MVPGERDDLTDLSSKRALMVAPEPFFTSRGTPMNVAQMCRVLTSHGLRLDLATYPLGEDLDLPGLTIHRAPRLPWISSVPIGFSWHKVAMDLSLSLLLLKLLPRGKYDLVHAVEESVFLVLPYTYFGIRSIYDLDSLISEQLAYSDSFRFEWLLRMVRRLERTALRRSAAAVTVCAALSDAVREICPTLPLFQIEDCPLEGTDRAPDPSAVEAIRRRLGLSSRKVIVYTGNFEPYQGVGLLVDAAETLRGTHPEVVVLILGGSESDISKLRSELAARGLQDVVKSVGHQPSQDLPEWMALADALVSPRIHGDNTPLKIYTYMYSGKPIVATNLLTHTQVLDSSVAVLTEPTARGLAQGIVEVLEQPEHARQLGRAASRRVRSEYSADAFSRKLLQAYSSLLGIGAQSSGDSGGASSS